MKVARVIGKRNNYQIKLSNGKLWSEVHFLAENPEPATFTLKEAAKKKCKELNRFCP